MQQDLGASALPTGLSQAEPEVSALRASIPSAVARRVQLSRKKGWRMPENTVRVARPSGWGNPCIVGNGEIETREDAVRAYRKIVSLPESALFRDSVRRSLAGKNLACWCPLDQPCHADVLLELANASAIEAGTGETEGLDAERESAVPQADATN